MTAAARYGATNSGERDEEALYPGAVGRPSGARFWILFWYSYLSALQSLLWMTFSSVPNESREYLHTSSQTLDLYLDEGQRPLVIPLPGTADTSRQVPSCSA